jgi:hypothetical protein
VKRRIVRVDDTKPRYGYDSVWYVEGNTIEGAAELTADNWQGGVEFEGNTNESTNRSRTPFPVATVATQPAAEAFQLVLRHAGATRPKRDAHDVRILGEVANGKATFGNGIVDTQTQVGGWPVYHSLPAATDGDHDGMPDAWERRHGFNPDDPADGRRDQDRDGYTNVEEFLNGTEPRRFLDYTKAENNVNTL